MFNIKLIMLLFCLFIFLFSAKVEDLFLLFAKKASEFISWFENAEEDLTDPVRCNSVEQIKVSFFDNSYILFYCEFLHVSTILVSLL